MPLIMIYANDIAVEAKAKIAREVTDVVAASYNVPPEIVSLYFIPLDPAATFNKGERLDRHGSPAQTKQGGAA